MVTLSPDELKTRIEDAVNLAKLEGKVDTGFKAVDGELKLLHVKMDSILEIKSDVKEHGKQIARWQGVSAVVAFALTIALGWLGKVKHWFLG